MAHDVFISYSQKDKLTADALCATLEKHQIRCWVAPRDIPPGILWEDAIVDTVSQARVMVVVLSDNANVSEHVINEVRVAVSRGIAILPFRIEEVVLCKRLELYLGSYHWLDALTPPLERHLEDLAARVKALLKEDGEPNRQDLAIAAPVKINGKWGFIDGRGNMIIQPQFDWACGFSEGLAPVKRGERWGYIDRMGWLKIPLRFGRASKFSEGLAAIQQGTYGKYHSRTYGYIDLKGNMAIPPQFYHMAHGFCEGLACVFDEWVSSASFGFCDRLGNMVIKAQFDRGAGYFSEGLTWGRPDEDDWNERAIFIDTQGNTIISTKTFEVRNFSEGLAAFKEFEEGTIYYGTWSSKWGFIDRQGNVVIPPSFDEAWSFSEGLALVRQGGYGFINSQGNFVIPPTYEGAGGFFEHLAKIRQGGQWGFIDSEGRQVIAPEFNEASRFSQGLAAIKKGSRFGFIDCQGDMIILPQFDDVREFTRILGPRSFRDFWYLDLEPHRYTIWY